MHMSTHKGIDYSLGQSNFDPKTGIHFGVIGMNSIMLEASEDFEPYYGEPHCPKCGNAAIEATESLMVENEWDNYSEHGCRDFACLGCEHYLDSSEVYPEESQGFTYERDSYRLTDCLDSDIFVLASPFYTRAQFCSPCVPGAGNLDNPCEDGPKTYALGHDWFENGRAPYRVFRVEDDAEVVAEDAESASA